MERIGGYEVVLTFSPIDEITGHVFEVFDYYLLLRDTYRTAMLFLGNMTPAALETAFRSKYNVDFDEVRPDLIYYSKEQLQTRNTFYFDQDAVVLVVDGNVQAMQCYKIRLLTRNLLGFLCYNEEMFLKNPTCTMYKDMVYLQDYRVYGQNRNFRSFDYVKKLPFRFYRRSDRRFNNVGMMYTTYTCRKITPQMVQDYHLRSGCRESILVVPYRLPEYDFIEGVRQETAPVPDFFDRFDVYIYTPVRRKFDCSPRLVTECFLQGKRVFMDVDYKDIGLETRLQDCKERLESLDLTPNDPILGIIDRMRRG